MAAVIIIFIVSDILSNEEIPCLRLAHPRLWNNLHGDVLRKSSEKPTEYLLQITDALEAKPTD